MRVLPLDLVSLFIVNEIEGGQLAGEEDAQAIVRVMREKFPAAAVALTLGAEGVLFADGEGSVRVGAEKAKAVDTTAAGDTFVGYLLAELTRGARPEAALKLACRAAAICVTRPGAADSIPLRKEVESRA